MCGIAGIFHLSTPKPVDPARIEPRPLDLRDVVRDIHKIETAIEPRFQEHFVNASAIPNAVELFPNLESIVSLPYVNFNTKTAGDEGGRRRRRG